MRYSNNVKQRTIHSTVEMRYKVILRKYNAIIITYVLQFTFTLRNIHKANMKYRMQYHIAQLLYRVDYSLNREHTK